MEQGQPIIIVNWKWNAFKGGVNSKIFQEKRYREHLDNIEFGKGHYYQEHLVEPSAMCENGKFVMLDIYKDDEDTMHLFYTVLDRYIQANSDVLLFLHRGHFYTEKDVAAIRERYKRYRLKCFLISDGRDFIYYAARKSGLLNDVGGFFIGVEEETGEYVKTFDKANGLVKQPYFDRVWAHYRFEFQSQVFELKEEIFSAWFELLLPHQPEEIAVSDLEDRLTRQGRALLYRINSFIGGHKPVYFIGISNDPEVIRLRQQEREIERLEMKEGKSFLFDDTIANLDFHDSLEVECYRDACQALKSILFDVNKKSVTKFALLDVAEKLNLLVKMTPGELSN